MSRFSKADRRERRRAQDELAVLGDRWLRIRDAGAFLADGCDSWDEYCRQVIAPTIPAAWRLSADQVEAFIAEALRLVEIRRQHDRRATRCR